MDVITAFQSASTDLAIAGLAAAVATLTGVIIRIVLCVLAASAMRRALEDLPDGQTDAGAVRAHRLAVLRAILTALSGRGHSKTDESA
jgi:hypothetical protein